MFQDFAPVDGKSMSILEEELGDPTGALISRTWYANA